MQKLRKGKTYEVDKDEYVAVSLNIRDRDHFYSIVHYLNRTLGRTGLKAQGGPEEHGFAFLSHVRLADP